MPAKPFSGYAFSMTAAAHGAKNEICIVAKTEADLKAVFKSLTFGQKLNLNDCALVRIEMIDRMTAPNPAKPNGKSAVTTADPP